VHRHRKASQLRGGRDRGAHIGLRDHVAAHESRLGTELGRDGSAPLVGEVGEHDCGAVSVQPARRRLAEPGCRAGYERDVAADFHGCAPLIPNRSAMGPTWLASPPTTTYSTLRTCDTVPTFSPLGLWMPICAPT